MRIIDEAQEKETEGDKSFHLYIHSLLLLYTIHHASAELDHRSALSGHKE